MNEQQIFSFNKRIIQSFCNTPFPPISGRGVSRTSPSDSIKTNSEVCPRAFNSSCTLCACRLAYFSGSYSNHCLSLNISSIILTIFRMAVLDLMYSVAWLAILFTTLVIIYRPFNFFITQTILLLFKFIFSVTV